jgi:hypothetical protein
VTYQGEPKFQPVEKTKVQRAVNTDKDIIKVGDMYYMCHEGVWFMGKSPTGPWSVCTKVPGEIYEIPISSPAHNVTYVTVEDDDDDEWATFATAAMYTGVMVAWGCAVWGSGYYYPPYYGGFYGGYPMYRGTTRATDTARRTTRGPGRTAAARCLRALRRRRRGRALQPADRKLFARRRAYGPYGAAGAARSYNPRTGTYGQTRQAPTSTAAGAAPRSSAATSGPAPTA